MNDDYINEKVQIYLNYKRQNKFMGIIDYKSLCILITYMIILGLIISILSISLIIKIYIYIILVIPFLALIIINTDQESAIDVLINIFKFILSPKIYIKGLKWHNCNNTGIYIKNESNKGLL